VEQFKIQMKKGDWLSVSEAAQLENISERAVQKRIKDDKNITRELEGRGGCSGISYEVNLLSLSPEAQALYEKHQISNYRNNFLQEMEIEGIEVPEEQQELALKRLEIVKQILSHRGPGKTEFVQNLSKELGENPRKLYRWVKSWSETKALSSLIRKRRFDLGNTKSFSLEAINYLKAAYINRQHALKAYNLLIEKAAEKGWNIGTYRSALRHISQIDPALLVYSNEGRKGLDDKVVPSIRRDYSDLEPMEILSGDHHVFDLMVQDLPRAKPYRPWITVFQDLRTRAIVGYCIVKQPNSESIAVALRHTILPKEKREYIFFGIPKTVYIDNGKDYRSKYLAGNEWKERNFGKIDLNPDTRGVFARLEIETIFANPYNAKAKAPERWFRTLEDQCIKDLPGYTGNKPENRPAERLIKETESGELLTIVNLAQIVEDYIVKIYHQNSHRGVGMKGKSPIENWRSCRKRGWEPKTVSSERVLDALLMRENKRKVNRGLVAIFNTYYEHPVLQRLQGETVEVRYDASDLSTIHVFHNNDYVCSAPAYNYASMKISHEELQNRIKQKRRAINNIVERHEDMMRSAGINPKVVGRSKIDNSEDATFILTGLEKTAEDMNEANESIKRKAVRKINPKELESWVDPWIEIEEDRKYAEEERRKNES